MKPRIVKGPEFREYFRFHMKYFSLSNNLHFNTQIFNTFLFCITVIVTSIFLGFMKPFFWAFAGAMAFTLTFLYFKTSKLAHGISIERIVKNMAREKQELEVRYVIQNETGFPFHDLYFEEFFEGIQNEKYLVSLGRVLSPNTRLEHTVKLNLNNGMGIKKFNPLQLVLTDELGIFEFTIDFKQEDEVHVYPFIEDVPTLRNKVSPESIEFGLYEISKRGDSNLFIGTRHYRPGDPVKYINWKLSLKSQDIVVNEFEKSTNTAITFLIDLDFDNQLGTGQISTWETAKDLALGLITKEINRYNSIQVIANNLFIPFGSGRDQLTTIEKHFTVHELAATKDCSHLVHLQNIPPQSQIYFLCPMLTTKKIEETFEYLKKLRVLNHSITIFIFNPYKELIRSIKGDMRKGILELERNSILEFGIHEKKFGSLGIKMFEIEVKQISELPDQMRKKAHSLIEAK